MKTFPRKAGSDPENAKILQLNRKVGAVVHTTGKIWSLGHWDGSTCRKVGNFGWIHVDPIALVSVSTLQCSLLEPL